MLCMIQKSFSLFRNKEYNLIQTFELRCNIPSAGSEVEPFGGFPWHGLMTRLMNPMYQSVKS